MLKNFAIKKFNFSIMGICVLASGLMAPGLSFAQNMQDKQPVVTVEQKVLTCVEAGYPENYVGGVTNVYEVTRINGVVQKKKQLVNYNGTCSDPKVPAEQWTFGDVVTVNGSKVYTSASYLEQGTCANGRPYTVTAKWESSGPNYSGWTWAAGSFPVAQPLKTYFSEDSGCQ